MRLLFLLVYMLLFITIALSQPVTITIVDSDSGSGVPYANILVKCNKTETITHATTNVYGVSKVNFCNSNTIITISCIGYKTLIDTLLKPIDTIYIEPDILNLNQVVVTATRTPKSLKDVPAITQVIEAKSIENRGLTNINDILTNEIPGLDFKQVGYGTDISMQGLSSKNILILIDGQPMAGENGNNIDYSRINTADIERVEIVKGATSSLYGSKAMGGVINIITKKTKSTFELSAGIKFEGYNQKNYPDKSNDDNNFFQSKTDLPNLNLNLSAGFNKNRLNGRTSFIAKSYDGYQLKSKYQEVFESTNIDTTIVKPITTTNIEGYEDYTITQKLDYRVKDNVIANGNISYYTHNQYDFRNDNKYDRYTDLNYTIKGVYTPTNKVELTAQLYHDIYKKYDFYEKLNEKDINYNNTILNPKVSGIIYIRKHTLNAGVELLHESLLSDKFLADTLIDKDANTTTAYFQDEIEINNFVITAGGRTDYHSTFGLHFTPKVSLMYKYGNHRFRLNYATGFRSPTLKELYMDWNILGMFTIKGDENLKPETNNYLSLSGEYAKNSISTSVNVYGNWFKNKIDGIWTENQTVYQYTNIHSTQIFGIETLFKYAFKNFIRLSCGYSYVYTTIAEENQMSAVSPNSGNIGIEYLFKKNNYNLNINLNSIITGAKDFSSYEEIEYRGEYVEAWYDVHYDAFSLWNLSVSQRFSQRINFVAGINNIFNYTADIVNFNTSITPGRRFFISIQTNIDRFLNSNNTKNKQY